MNICILEFHLRSVKFNLARCTCSKRWGFPFSCYGLCLVVLRAICKCLQYKWNHGIDLLYLHCFSSPHSLQLLCFNSLDHEMVKIMGNMGCVVQTEHLKTLWELSGIVHPFLKGIRKQKEYLTIIDRSLEEWTNIIKVGKKMCTFQGESCK